MRSSSYKRKSSDELFLLKDLNSNIIYAISEDSTLVDKYYEQFEKFFDKSKYSMAITVVNDRQYMHRLYSMFYDTLFLEEFKEGLVLTTQEISYYTCLLAKIYEDQKTMIGQLLFNESLLGLSGKDLEVSHNAFKLYYDKCSTFQSFIESIDINIFKERYLIDPNKVEELMQMEADYDRNMSR